MNLHKEREEAVSRRLSLRVCGEKKKRKGGGGQSGHGKKERVVTPSSVLPKCGKKKGQGREGRSSNPRCKTQKRGGGTAPRLSALPTLARRKREAGEISSRSGKGRRDAYHQLLIYSLGGERDAWLEKEKRHAYY